MTLSGPMAPLERHESLSRRPRAPIMVVEMGMIEKTKEQAWSGWVATQGVDHFQERLNAETEDGKYKILAQLLSSELEKLKKPPLR